MKRHEKRHGDLHELAKAVAACLAVIACFGLSIVVGTWLLAGGVSQVVGGAEMAPVGAAQVFLGLLRMVLAVVAGWGILCAGLFLCSILGLLD